MVRVLVVEDEANIREMIALNLRLTGMEAVEAESAEAALPLLAKKIGLDPAVMASPLITTIVDFLSLMAYFSVAVALLPQFRA